MDRALQNPSNRIGTWVFAMLVGLHAWPVLGFPWFPTLDGPTHLYNARIIVSLLSGDPGATRFFALDPFPEPNWLGHAIMAAVMCLSSAQAAEKTVMLLYVVGLPLSFRFAARRLGATNALGQLLVFPFIYGFTFRIGFLNFSLGLPLLLISIGVGIRAMNAPSRRTFYPLAGLLLALYFAHLTCFLMAVLALVTLAYPKAWATSHEGGITWLAAYWRRAKPLLLAALPGLALCMAFFVVHQDPRTDLKRLPMADLLTDLVTGRPFVALSDGEAPGARLITWAMMALTMVAILTGHRSAAQRAGDNWALVPFGLSLAAYLLVPDQMATGGFITVRLLLFVYLFWAIWLALQPARHWLSNALLLVLSCAQLFQLRIHYDHTKGLNDELADLLAIGHGVPKDAALIPLNYSGNWMHSNFPCYLGAINSANVLDNFGARTAHMPVRWRGGSDPGDAVGTFATSDRPCVRLNAGIGASLVNEVLTWKLNEAVTDSCADDVRSQLGAGFEQVAVSPLGDARLFRRR